MDLIFVRPKIVALMLQRKSIRYSWILINLDFLATSKYFHQLRRFIAISRDSLAFMFSKEAAVEGEVGDQIIVFFTEDASVGVKPIRS